MDKQSYVVLEHIFQAPASQLRSCSFRRDSRAYDSRLCEQSYTSLMGRLGLEPEGWVHTILLELSITSSRETLRRQSRQQSRTFGNSDDFVTQPLAQQSLRANRSIPRPIQPAAGTNPVFSSPYRYTEESSLLANDTSSRIPGVRHQQSVSRDSYYGVYRSPPLTNNTSSRTSGEWHQQLVNRDSYYDVYGGYQRFERSGRVPPPEDNGKDAKVSFKNLVVLLVVGTFFWWRWRSR